MKIEENIKILLQKVLLILWSSIFKLKWLDIEIYWVVHLKREWDEIDWKEIHKKTWRFNLIYRNDCRIFWFFYFKNWWIAEVTNNNNNKGY